jgi:hypothetical protein
MSLANIALTNTFNEWRIRTNQLVTEVNDINANNIATFVSNNAGLRITTSPIRKGNIYFQLNVSTVTSDTASFNLASALSVNLVSNNATFANTVATTAFNQANAANSLAFAIGGALVTNNVATSASFDKANAANLLAFTANVTANYANVLARTAFEIASLAVGNNTPALALFVAQTAFGFANTVNVATVASFGVANAALPNTTVTLNGSLLANAYVNTTSGFYSGNNGTALRPAYSWTTDNFTGMYRVGANTVGFSTAAASRLVIDANGFVGIGTTTPSKLLEISGGSSEVFVGTGSISGNVLTIGSVISGQINVGHYVTDEGLNVLGGTYVKEYFSGTGGLGTYNLTTSQATVTSTTIYAFNMHNNTFRITGTDTNVNPGQPIGMIEFASDDADLTSDERSRAFVYAVNEQANAGATLMFGTAIGSRESTEKLRINRFGAVGIGGANFGTAGQTLQSNGNSSPPIWVNNFAFDRANAANILAFNTGIGANAFASATIAGANTVVGGGANAFASATIAGANTVVGGGANAFASATIAGANIAVGTGANTVAVAAFAKANSTTYTSNVVISVADNINAALRITQNGTGNALLVEDSANPDATPFVIDAIGRVGIGTTLPSGQLDVTGTTGTISINTTGDQISFNSNGYNYITASSANSSPGANSFLVVQASDVNGILQFNTSGLERARIHKNGNFGIGTSDPLEPLHVQGTIRVQGDNNRSHYFNSTPVHVGEMGVGVLTANANSFGITTRTASGSLSLGTNTQERLRINGTGAVGFGGANFGSAGQVLTSNGPNQPPSWTPAKANLTGGNAFTGNQFVDGFTRFGNYGGMFQGVTILNNAGSGSNTSIAFVDFQNENFISTADIFATMETDGSATISFDTTPPGSRTVDRRLSRMRITGNGALLLGTTSEFVWNGSNGTGVGFFQDGHAAFIRSNNPAMSVRRLDSSGQVIAFGRDSNNVGSISVTGSATAYNTSSDYRLKENLTPVTGALTRVNNLPVWRFNFIGDDKIVDGFMAHEAQTVVPESVTGHKDEVDGDGKPVYQGIDQSKLVPLLFAAVKELSAQVTNLTARVAALEAAS